MLLRSLNELYDQLLAEDRLPPIGYERKPVRFLVELDADGGCLSVLDTAPDETEKLVPEMGRTREVRAFVGCDKGEYVLGLPQSSQDASAKKAAACHEAFLQRLDEAAKALQDKDTQVAAALRAIKVFAADRDRAIHEFRSRAGVSFVPDSKGRLAEASSRVGFRVDRNDPVDSPAVREWWAEVVNEKLVGEDGVCQVTGNRLPLARIMPGVSIRPGPPQALISANFDSAERYSAEKSAGAQISVPVAIRSHQALNWLLRDPHHHRRVGELTFVWWLDSSVEFDPLDLIVRPHADDVASLLASPWTGRRGLAHSDSFRLLGLASTKARVVIRFDHLSTLGDIERRTQRWLELIAQTDRDGRIWWPAIWNLADAGCPPGEGSARKARRDRIIESLASSAVTGAPLPRAVLAAVIDRCRAVPVPRNGTKTDWRAIGSRLACLRLYAGLTEEKMMKQDQSIGELCGRLLAHLEYTQYRALGGINRTLVDRYYSSASVMPQTVFPGLFRTANAHISRVGRTQSKGAQIAIKKRLGDLCTQIQAVGGFPAMLTLEQQAQFALGFWGEQQSHFQHPQSLPSDALLNDEEV